MQNTKIGTGYSTRLLKNSPRVCSCCIAQIQHITIFSYVSARKFLPQSVKGAGRTFRESSL